MMKKFFLAFLVFVLASDAGVYAANQTNPTSTKEELMEDIFISALCFTFIKKNKQII
jgi:hypothetical protein